jgi:5-methylcytosine-specific restriction endonuclease McrA
LRGQQNKVSQSRKVYITCIVCGKRKLVSPSKRLHRFCCLKCWYKYNSGENSNWWKGGITPLIIKIRESNNYQKWRMDVFTRDNFTCQECGNRQTKGHQIILNAHHEKSFSKILYENNILTLDEALNCKELWNIDNGKTLCEKCHKKRHKNRKYDLIYKEKTFFKEDSTGHYIPKM